MMPATLSSQVREFLDGKQFGRAYSKALSTAQRYNLYTYFAKDFEIIRILGFKHKDWEQAGFALVRLAAKLEKDISVMEIKA